MEHLNKTDKRQKRKAFHAPIQQNDIYISRKSNFIALLNRAQKLINTKK